MGLSSWRRLAGQAAVTAAGAALAAWPLAGYSLSCAALAGALGAALRVVYGLLAREQGQDHPSV